MRGHGTLDTEELPYFQRRATHLCEFGHETRQIRLGHHERRWWRLGGCYRAADEFRSSAITKGRSEA